jgi:endonuclease/exonuclease/phosphatase family metal-dependent hydrolase
VKARVLSYNIHKGIGGLDRRYRPERICDVIAHYDPDIVLLQEVADGARRSRGHRQVDLIGDIVGLDHRTWFPNVDFRRGGQYGNAILSRFHLTETSNVDLTVGRRRRRSVLHARYRVRLHNGRRQRTLHVFNLHLGLTGSERNQQLERFLASHPFAGLHGRTPLIVGGDFNDVWGTLGGRFLEPRGFRGMDSPLRTFPAFAPARALDSIYVRGDIDLGHVFRSRLSVAKRASDHLPLVADIDIG